MTFQINAWIFNRFLGNCKYFVTFNYQRRRYLNNLRGWFIKHEWLKTELWYAHEFIELYFKFKYSAGIFKNFSLIHEITQQIL